jgi:hypothetical protein
MTGPGADPVPRDQTGLTMSVATAVTVPWTLRAAAGLVSVEALVECVAVTGRSDLTAGLRGALVLCLALKWLLAWGALRLSAGAALGLLLFEGTTAVAALGAVGSAPAVRLALGATALIAIGLLLASLHAFPTVALPPSPSEDQ